MTKSYGRNPKRAQSRARTLERKAQRRAKYAVAA